MSDDVLIRDAREGDEAEIANVHVSSWREAYRGLLPQRFLDDLPMAFKRRMSWWRKVISEPRNFVLQVAEAGTGIVGFACMGAGRDPGRETMAEVLAIYLMAKYKGKGIGFSLLSSGFRRMAERGFAAGYCWVLESNPTIAFYERSGATFHGTTKEAEIGGQKVKELAYAWDPAALGALIREQR